jgi:hypothetical protein
MAHPNWTPLPEMVATDSYAGFKPSGHAVAAALVAIHFTVDVPRRLDEAIEDMGYHEFHDAVRRGFLRVEIVDGGFNLAHVVHDLPSDAPKRSRVSFGPGLTV